MKFFLLSKVDWVTPDELEQLAGALAIHAARCAAAWDPVWQLKLLPVDAPPSFAEGAVPGVAVASDPSQVPADGVPVVLSPTIDDPTALAYHEWLGSRPCSIVLADRQQVDLAGVQEATGHEVLETLVDPMTSAYAGGYAIEVCDPVQGASGTVEVAGARVVVPDYVTPRWFGLDAGPAGFDAFGAVDSAFAILPTGYAVQVGRDLSAWVVGQLPLPPHKLHPLSRLQRRVRAARGG